MKKILYGLLALGVLLAAPGMAEASVDCLFKTGCERKVCELESEMQSALDHGNTAKAERLRRELEEFLGRCPDGEDLGGLERELDRLAGKIRDYEREVADIAAEFHRETAKATALARSGSRTGKALAELAEGIDDVADDVAEAGRDLKEDVDEFCDETADVAVVPVRASSGAQDLLREIDRAEAGLAASEQAMHVRLDDFLSLVRSAPGVAGYEGGYRDAVAGINARFEAHRRLLEQVRQTARDLLDRAS